MERSESSQVSISDIYSSVFDIIYDVDTSSIYKLMGNPPDTSHNYSTKGSDTISLLHILYLLFLGRYTDESCLMMESGHLDGRSLANSLIPMPISRFPIAAEWEMVHGME
ncbi:hypothetical protein HNY73_014442 [Argiope bruennichi]|uniref:Uncharacterized protein n=1 Tax=Argiope bruennichi TaxID=94029 RepID=A0A8T0ENY5_ARGBR|nr:hypothetical protein HNY73_014442 [Argiope bruennichi]